MIPLFDLHCDTFLGLYHSNQSLYDNSLHVSLKKALQFKPYVQIASIWSDFRLSNDQAFESFLNVCSYIKAQKINFATKVSTSSSPAFILGVEDARLLNNNINRLYTLYSIGVRVLTLNWKGITCIGGGWDTNFPLTSFGKNVVQLCKKLNIVVDVSHSSTNTFWDVMRLSQFYEFVPIASHSNSFSVFNHKRNLSDEQFIELSKINSLVGISLAPEHLGKNPNIKDILVHINHYLSLNGENNIALGCDFDGVSSLPEGITSMESLPILFSAIEKNFGKKIARKIFFENAFCFFNKKLH